MASKSKFLREVTKTNIEVAKMLGNDRSTSWIGAVGGGISGKFLLGGSVLQFDLHHMAGTELPVRVLLKTSQVGVVAGAGAPFATLVVTGCRNASEMSGLSSSGIDWDLKAGISASGIAKNVLKIFRSLSNQMKTDMLNWAVHDGAKMVLQYIQETLADEAIKPGRQFHLFPWPATPSVECGVFYQRQELILMRGHVGWQHYSPRWYVESSGENLRLHLKDIPDENGKQLYIRFAIPSFGYDEEIVWKSRNRGRTEIPPVNERQRFHGYITNTHVIGYVIHGRLQSRGFEMGINLGDLQPVGRKKGGTFGSSESKEVQKGGTLKVRILVKGRDDHNDLWESEETIEMIVGSDGRFVGAKDGMRERS